MFLRPCLLVAAWITLHNGLAFGQPDMPPDKAKKADAKDALKEIAGSAEFLRAVPKRFGKLQAIDETKRTVTVLFQGDKKATTWPLTPDAEIKVRGWWGRLSDLQGDLADEPRVWAWFKVDRKKQPTALFMLADDLSEQDIHGDGLIVQSITDKTIVLGIGKGEPRTVERGETVYLSGGKATPLTELKEKQHVYLHRAPTKKDAERRYLILLLDREQFEKVRDEQKEKLRQRWLKEGLPGAIGFLHVYSGEVDVLLDHEAMRWGRALSTGDKVSLGSTPDIQGVVKSVAHQREKTQVRLVVRSIDLADLAMGQRVHLKMPAPAKDVEFSLLPPGIDGPKAKQERIDWFLANIYCTCKVGGDGCTGHFYSLASCNPNSCGAPNMTRKYIGKAIDDGLSNREIFEALLKQRGPTMLRPHLLP